MGDSLSQWQLVQEDHEAGDDVSAMVWLEMAAVQNYDAQAMYTLGRLILSRASIVSAEGVKEQVQI